MPVAVINQLRSDGVTRAPAGTDEDPRARRSVDEYVLYRPDGP